MNHRFRPIHLEIREDVLGRIQSGEYKPGDRLPTEKELMLKFGTSKSPVRQALEILRVEGYIHRHPGRGTFVAPSTQEEGIWTIGSIQDVFGLGAQTKFQLLDFSPGQNSEEMKKIFKSKKGDFLRIQGLRLLKDKPLYYLTVVLPQKIGKNLRPEDIQDTPVIVVLEKKLNIPLKKCVQNISAGVVNQKLAKYLHTAPQSPMLCIERLYFTDQEEPIEWARSFFRASSFKHRSILSRK
jgi:GntR family transcriptional regulator